VEPTRDANVAQLDDFDEVIDVRSPAEFAHDHVPGAINAPVLDDAERARVGTLYKQSSPFEAKRAGAALVARNIAFHIDGEFSTRPRHWRPLIYCWRGGGRSDAMREVLRRIGWRAARLAGGYQAYRRFVVDALETEPARYRFRVVCGRTGSGKSRILQALEQLGVQVLDLERLASHRGSVLGEVPNTPQPSQKMFESRLWAALRKLDPMQVTFVEAESRKIGNVQVPGALITRIRTSPCVVLEAPLPVRVALLLDEYRHFLHDFATLSERLTALTSHYGRETVEDWISQARAGQHADLVTELLCNHYDPAYERSIRRNFANYANAPSVTLESADADGIAAAAMRMARICVYAAET
jgi:tRNA 2-selenouridine synthase